MSSDSQREALEDWVNESTRRCLARGFLRGRFHELRTMLGTVPAITQLIGTPLELTPLRRLKAAGLLEWSLEACVLHFPECFDQGVRNAAKFRLEHANDDQQGTSIAPASGQKT